jgi:FAD/FMN-containing dehydrogenase
LAPAIDRRRFLTGAGGAIAVAYGLRGGAPASLHQAMRGPIISRGAPGFAAAAHVYSERFDHVTPLAVARPLDALDVRAAVRWAVAHGVRAVARSGGHSYGGYSTVHDGLVLDLRQMQSIHVNRRARTATVGAGAQLIDVYAGLAAAGATLPAGSCPSVGVAGVTLGGGMGLAARQFGLTTDNLLAAQIVTADGRVREVDRRSDPELLWALRGGGGGNFGVVTRFTFKVHPLPASAAWFVVSWPWEAAGAALAAWLGWAPHARNELTSILHLQSAAGRPSVTVTGQYLGRAAELTALLRPITAIGGAAVSSGDQAYLGLQLRWAGCLQQPFASCHTAGTRPGGTLARSSFRAKSDYLSRPLPAAAREQLLAAVERRARSPGSAAILFDSYGGAINRVERDATAFVHRRELCAIQYLTYGGGASWLGATHAAMRPYVSGGAYQNYIDPELTTWRAAYYGANYHRLVAVQKRVDPDHFFNFPQAIGR